MSFSWRQKCYSAWIKLTRKNGSDRRGQRLRSLDLDIDVAERVEQNCSIVTEGQVHCLERMNTNATRRRGDACRLTNAVEVLWFP